MTLRERIHIRAAPEQVWALIADPIRMAEWNPKIVAVDRDSPRSVRTGERFRLIYRMRGQDRETEAEVIECQEPSDLVIRHHPLGWSVDRYVDERYHVRSSGDTTRLTQEIDLTHSEVPLWLQAVGWFIHLVGEPVAKPYLVSLKELAEKPEPKA